MLIIDANNLAGKLQLLDKKDFDLILIKIIQDWNRLKNKRIVLVFDGFDVMGDKYEDKRIVIVRTPKDSYYRNADDKIIEIIKGVIEDSTLITDDNELIKKALYFSSGKFKLNIKKATKLALEIEGSCEMEYDKDYKKEDNSINDELLKIWS